MTIAPSPLAEYLVDRPELYGDFADLRLVDACADGQLDPLDNRLNGVWVLLARLGAGRLRTEQVAWFHKQKKGSR